MFNQRLTKKLKWLGTKSRFKYQGFSKILDLTDDVSNQYVTKKLKWLGTKNQFKYQGFPSILDLTNILTDINQSLLILVYQKLS